MSHKVRFTIQRFDPNKDKKKYFQEYEIEINPWETILEALIQIRRDIDPSLAFRMSCKSAICGSCAMIVNGRAKLTCKTKISDEVKKFGKIKIESMGNLKVLKDLVIDMDDFYKEMKDIEPWLKKDSKSDEKHESETLIKPHETKRIEKSSECLWCGACFSDCPSRDADKSYIGPAASVVAHRHIFDTRDENTKNRLKKVVDKNIWMCAHCEKATENCPMDIAPQEIISELREESIKQGITNNDGARHAKTITKSVKKYGELDEFNLPLGTFGPIRVLKELPAAIRLFLKGKLPPIFMKKIKNHEQITQLDNDIKRKHNK